MMKSKERKISASQFLLAMSQHIIDFYKYRKHCRAGLAPRHLHTAFPAAGASPRPTFTELLYIQLFVGTELFYFNSER